MYDTTQRAFYLHESNGALYIQHSMFSPELRECARQRGQAISVPWSLGQRVMTIRLLPVTDTTGSYVVLTVEDRGV